jgi:hypothetical protein
MKKWLALFLAVLLVLATAGVAFADDSGIDAEPVGEAKVISFDTKSAGWDGFNYVGFHIWNVSGDSEFKHHDWGAKKERGTDADGDGIWTFDFDKSGLTLRDDAQYAVVFYNNKGGQTYNLLFDTACYGDTAFCDLSIVYENPEDSSKKAAPAYWSHQDPAVNGPQLCVTSIGNVQGSCVPRGITRVDLFNNFLDNTLENARTFSGLSDQELLDNLGAGLELDAETVRDALAASGHAAEWSYEASTLPKYNLEPTEEPIGGGATEYPVKVEVAAGNGTAVSDKDTVSIGIGISPEYAYDTVTLTATPYKDTLPNGENGETFYSPYDYLFFGWDIDGDYTIENGGSLSDAVVTLKVTGAIYAYAYFVPCEAVPGADQYALIETDITVGKGSAKASQSIVSYNFSVAPPHVIPTVSLDAVPEDGYRFGGWKIEGSYIMEDGYSLTDAHIVIGVSGNVKAHAQFYIDMPVVPGDKLGDADGDGKVTIIDATRIQRYMAKLIPASQINLTVSDTDGDTKVTILDATRIQRVLAGLCDWEGNPVAIPEPTMGEYEGPITG